MSKSISSKVYFLPWDERSRFAELLELPEFQNTIKSNDFVAIKMHFGEKGTDGYIRPEFVRPVIQFAKNKKAKPFLTDTCTIYHGKRANAIDHIELAATHGFSENKLHAPVVIADGLKGQDFGEVKISGTHFKSVKIAKGILSSDSIICMSHFKGHLLAGFGGALKNIGMGCAPRQGKFEMHSSLSPQVDAEKCTACGACVISCSHGALSIVNDKIKLDVKLCKGCGQCIVTCKTKVFSANWEREGSEVQQRFVEYAAGALKNKRALYLNFINHITPNCDCMSADEKPLLDDVGIMASLDPVAIDQASLDLVIKKAGDVFKEAHPKIDSSIQLAHAEKMGLGSRTYTIVTL